MEQADADSLRRDLAKLEQKRLNVADEDEFFLLDIDALTQYTELSQEIDKTKKRIAACI